MKKCETKTVTSSKVLTEVLCDLCGESCRVQPEDVETQPAYGSDYLREDEFSYGTLKFSGDYNGNYDGINISLELCEECTMRIYRQSRAVEPFHREQLGLDAPDGSA